MKLSLFLVPAVLLTADAALSQSPFQRGDANDDDTSDISDAVATLSFLFSGGPASTCADAADTNDDGRVDISDAVALLSFLFSGGDAPRQPFPDCGADPTDGDGQGCAAYTHCTAACYGQAELDRSLDESIQPIVCIPADSVAPVTVGALTVTVCPSSEARPCPGPGATDPLGCPVNFTGVAGTLDVPSRTVTIHLEGEVDDLPIIIVDGGQGVTVACQVDIVFSGDVVVEFVAASQGGQLVIQSILDPFLQDEVITMTTANTQLICRGLVALQDLFKAELVAQLQAASEELLAGLREELVGQTLCAP